jgi:hypothetical protein
VIVIKSGDLVWNASIQQWCLVLEQIAPSGGEVRWFRLLCSDGGPLELANELELRCPEDWRVPR